MTSDETLHIWRVAAILALFSFATVVNAQVGSAKYAFLIASGFLCDPSDVGACPAVAKSVSGDSYEISGAGAFDAQSKSVKAAGTFTHKSANGNVLETGVWTANSLISFDSYGIQPAALMQKGAAFGGPRVNYKRTFPRPSTLPTGGLAIFQIVLMPVSGPMEIAVLQVNCALANTPRERSVEGIRIKLEGRDIDYSEEAGGRIVFLAQRVNGTAPGKVQEQQNQPEEPHK